MKSFVEYISELKVSLECHDKLNPALWSSDEKLKNEVRNALLRFAKTWSSFAKIPEELIQDIVMTGGNANYNYTKKSDIDVHIIIDRSKLFNNSEYVEEYLQAKKSLWTLTHKISVYGYALEPYAQDQDIKYPKSQGVYSVLNDSWIVKPEACEYDYKNDVLLKQKVRHYMHTIDDIIKSKMGIEAIDTLKSKFRDMRSAGIQRYGEYSRENLIFKELRNRGYLDKMNKYQKSLKDSSLSLK